MSRRSSGLALLGTLLVFVACSHLSSSPARPDLPPEALAAQQYVVPADEPWTRTAIRVGAGQVVEFWADGQVQVGSSSADSHLVGPSGTYLYANAEAEAPYPLPAGSRGPAPPFALLGKVGENGRPFLVGEHRSVAT